MKKIIVFLLVAMLSTTIAGCSSQSNQTTGAQTQTETTSQSQEQGQDTKVSTETPKPNEEPKQTDLVVAIPQDPDFIDPHKAVASGTEEVMFNVFEGLLKADSEGKMIPAVASSYKVSDDGLVYEFILRDVIKFHNGKDVTIQDVEYSYKRLRGDFSDEPLSAAFKDVGIEVVDDKTIRFTLSEANSSFLVNFTEAVLSADLSEEEQNEHPVGTGPYKFVEYVPSQKIVLQRFDDYWGKVPQIENVEFRIFADSQTALMSLQAGEVDMYPRIPTENLDMLPDDYTYVEGPQNMTQIMAMNNKVEPFNNVLVRQAVNYAIDTDQIIEACADGKGTKLGSNMSPAMKLYYQDGLTEKYNKNIEKAKELLKEAGYPDGFKTSITVPSNYEFHVKTGEVIAEQLKEVGIDAEIKQVEWSVWLDQVYSGRDYDMTIIGFTGKLDPYQILDRYESTYAKNFMNYSNSDYDALMKQAITTVDENDRATIYKEAQKILAEDVPCVYIMDPNLIVAMKKNLKGYTQYPVYVQDISTLYFE